MRVAAQGKGRGAGGVGANLCCLWQSMLHQADAGGRGQGAWSMASHAGLRAAAQEGGLLSLSRQGAGCMEHWVIGMHVSHIVLEDIVHIGSLAAPVRTCILKQNILSVLKKVQPMLLKLGHQ